MRSQDARLKRGGRVWLILAVAAVILLAGCRGGTEGGAGGEDERPLVVTTIPVLYSLTASIAGEDVRLENLLRLGASPHEPSFTPEQARLVADADLLIVNGAGLDPWADELAAGAGRSGLQKVVASAGVEFLRPGDATPLPGGEDEHEEEAAEGVDPHVWLDARNAERMVTNIRDGLQRLDPDNAQAYEERAAAYQERLRGLHEEIVESTADLPRKDFVSFHSAWAYYARAYGLRQAAVIQEFPGQDPGPRYLTGLVDLIRDLDVTAVIAEPQFSDRPARALAAETGARVYTADPEGSRLAAEMYEELMRDNTDVFVTALGGTGD